MTRKTGPDIAGCLIACFLIAAAGASQADEVKLPPGNLNGASNTCPNGARSAEFQSKRKSWTLTAGQRLVIKAREGDDFKMRCAHDGVTLTVGTGCFFDGYVVAGFEPGAMRIACYEGAIPKELSGK